MAPRNIYPNMNEPSTATTAPTDTIILNSSQTTTIESRYNSLNLNMSI